MAINEPAYRPSLDIWNRNPVIIYALVNSLVAATTAFGLALDGQQVAVIMGIANILLSLIYNVPMVSPIANAQAVNEALMMPSPAQNSTVTEVKKVEVEEAN